MIASELIDKLKTEKPETVYFLFGQEKFYHAEIVRALKANIVTEENEEFNLQTFEAKSTSIEEWLGAANTFSFLGGRKLVVIRDLHESSLDKKAVESFLNYINEPSPETCLVLMADKVDRKRKLDRVLVGLKTAVDCAAPPAAVLPGWLQTRAKSFGYQLSSNAARMMVERIGPKPGLLAMELEKVIVYSGEEKIDEILVGEVVGAFKLENVFELTNAVKAKNHAESLRFLARQLHYGEEPLRILVAIIWQFRFIWEVQHYMKSRLSTAQIAKAMSVRPFVVEKALPFAKAFSQQELRAGFESLFEADRALKTSGGEPERIMEGLVLRLCSGT